MGVVYIYADSAAIKTRCRRPVGEYKPNRALYLEGVLE